MNADTFTEILGVERPDAWLREIEAGLERALSSGNPFLVDPGLRVVRGGGKRLRPILTIAVSLVHGATKWHDDSIRGAVAVELVHVGSLVHDDIIDNASERRGVPTVNAVEGPNHAVLVGDYLLARSGVEAATISKEVAEVLAQTIADLCDGQSLEARDTFNLDRTVDAWLQSIQGKTAALMRASCRIGALCARLPEDEVEGLSRFGESFGIAFQIVDDVLDIISTSAGMGKPVGNDLREGVYTLPVIHALERSENGLRSLLGDRTVDVETFNKLLELVRNAGGVERAIALARRYNREAAAALEPLPQTAVVRGLARLPDAYLHWALPATTATTSSGDSKDYPRVARDLR